MTTIVGLSPDRLIDRPHFDAVRARMGESVFDPALKEVLRQLWKIARTVATAEAVADARRAVKQILVIADRFGLSAVRDRAEAVKRALAGFPREGTPPPEAEALWEKLRDALWETQALIESGSLYQRGSKRAA